MWGLLGAPADFHCLGKAHDTYVMSVNQELTHNAPGRAGIAQGLRTVVYRRVGRKARVCATFLSTQFDCKRVINF